jgi:hypothetical protein
MVDLVWQLIKITTMPVITIGQPAICTHPARAQALLWVRDWQIAGFDTELYISYLVLIHNFNKTRDGLVCVHG